ncbi:MAG: 50S ribosomal protein L9 [Candidatus Limnocylindria bacterium]
MRVILKREVTGLGRAGEIKDVADGYAQNFLVPRGLAVEANAGELRRIAQQRASQKAKEERAQVEAQGLGKRLEAVTLVFKLKAGEQGKTFGSVTTKDIVEALQREANVTVDKTKIHLEEPLRTLGSHRVEVRLAPEVRAQLTVAVEAA